MAAPSALRQRPELLQDGDHVDLVPGLGDHAVGDPQDRRGCELDPPAGRCDAGELAVVGAAPGLVGGDQVVLGEDELDRVLEVGEGVEEGGDGLALAVAPAALAVVDEVLGEQPVAGAEIAPVDRLGVEASDDLLVGALGDARTLSPARLDRGWERPRRRPTRRSPARAGISSRWSRAAAPTALWLSSTRRRSAPTRSPSATTGRSPSSTRPGSPKRCASSR